MKFRKFGRISLALAVSLGTGLGVTSCSTDHTVGYMYVTGQQYNQISGFRIDNNLGNLTARAELSLQLRRRQSHQGAGGQCGKVSLCAERRLRRNRAGGLFLRDKCG